jgi:hypothetical protein
MKTGFSSTYEWLETDHDLRTLLDLCPAIVASRYLAITSIDSGQFAPSEVDLSRGWKQIGGIAYSPLIRSVEDLPRNCCCDLFDEWYLFETPPALGKLCYDNIFTTELASPNVFAFVNFYFRPSLLTMRELSEFFWKQINWMQPETYVANGADCLVFATGNRHLFNLVYAALERNPCV